MNHKPFFTMFSLFVALSLLVLPGLGMRAGAAETDAVLGTWYGAWQMGPTIDGAVLGCNPGDGVARHTGVYYAPDNRVYFLGARCETDTITSGAVFYFDLDTRVYGVTGASMPVPVSNYQAVIVSDDGQGKGPGLYIVGGREASGAQTTAVQVYYPEDNSTANITTDPYSTADPRSPGAVVSANDQIFAIGGFDGVGMYDDTQIYDPLAAPGDRWSDSGVLLPSGRSYIAAVAVGNLIYLMGGDEYISASLVPTAQTLVLDTTNVAAGWQDSLMADMPYANGDAPAVYVDEGYLGGDAGGIFVIGGYWPSPGPYRWVFRYDIASDTWDSFPSLAIPSPATGRRNMAAAYVSTPINSITGLGDGSTGIWVFGGFDGTAANAMTGSSEFFSLEDNPILLLPESMSETTIPGGTATHAFNLLNLTESSDSFDLSYTSASTWDVVLPASIGPILPGEAGSFDMVVTIPADQDCPDSADFTVTATSQSDPLISDAEEVSVDVVCYVDGVVTDATTGLPIENAYVFIQNTADGLDEYFDAHTDADGYYLITGPGMGDYFMGSSAENHQASFYPLSWPEGAANVTFVDSPMTQDFSLLSSLMDWSPTVFDIEINPGTTQQQTLTISNDGTGPLYFFLTPLADTVPSPPPAASQMPVEGLPRVDPQLLSNLENSPDGTADFVVVLKSQADLSGAQNIPDWKARGVYVYNQLKSHAELTQVGVRRMIQTSGVSYHPVSVINALIIHGGDLELVNSLAARGDVAQIVANRQIAVEEPLADVTILSPDAIEWNIKMVGADTVWDDFGITGEGIVVAEIDTGTQWDHPALINQYRGWDGSTADHNYNWYDPYGQSPDVPNDAYGHGTHVMGTMVGDDGFSHQIGMAPGAQWISCDGTDDISGYLLTDELLQCADWILAPTDLAGLNPDPSMRPHVVNNSWGGGQNDYWYSGVIDSWRAAGIFPMFSNGNEGPSCSTAGSPGDNWNAFSAGASDADDLIVDFSSRGPALLTGYLKPDITAPGGSVESSVPTDAYAIYSGTSMASPHVAGAIALLWSANPALVGQVDLSGWLLQQSAEPKYTDEGCGGDLPTDLPNNTWGYGRLDAYAAVNLALAGGFHPEWLMVSPLTGVVPAGGSQDVTLTFSATVDMTGQYGATLWLVADDPENSDVRIPVTMMITQKPIAEFTSNSPILLGETAVFTNTSTGLDELTYLWDFGDGITSTLESPTHTYTTAATYNVTLTAYSQYGEDTVIHEFVVEALPVEEPLYYYIPIVFKAALPE